MSISRRQWLETTSVATLGIATVGAGCDDTPAGAPRTCSDPDHPIPPNVATDPYTGAPDTTLSYAHGVASGDPLTDGVILWTRVAGVSSGSIDVFYEVALDPAFTVRITAGTTTTSDTRDYTVKVDASGLQPGNTYYYRFRARGMTSPVGRTRTLPKDDVARLRFIMCSCTNYAYGYFHAYRNMAARDDVDFVVHLGDYIYEYGVNGSFPSANLALRTWSPANEIVTLDDYRTRYKQYRSDPDLQIAHQQFPWICIHDDHEIANDAWDAGAQNHMAIVEGDYATRKAAALQAMAEYLPIREQPNGTLYRGFRFGDLMDFTVLDTRTEGRKEQLPAADVLTLDDAAHTMISATQEAWLATRLAASTSRWNVVAQQVMMAQGRLNAADPTPLTPDGWDGYPTARRRIFDLFAQHENVVVLTGDFHSSFGLDLTYDPWGTDYDPATGRGAVAVELVCPGITSPAIFGSIFDQALLDNNPHLQLLESTSRGYTLLDVDRRRIQAEWYFVEGVDVGQGAERFGMAGIIRDGVPHVEVGNGPSAPAAGCPAAP